MRDLAPSKFREDAVTLRRRLLDAAEIVDRVLALEDDAERLVMTRSDQVVQYLIMRHGCLDQEVLGCLYLDLRHRLIADAVLFSGTIVNLTVEPRVLLRKALEWAATSMVVWHTHPSGDPTPSTEDMLFTQRLVEAGKVVGVEVLDHLDHQDQGPEAAPGLAGGREAGCGPDRWKKAGGGEDGRNGPKTAPPNKLSPAERELVLRTINSPEFRDLPPTQIVPRLADANQYLASEATMYRMLREEDQLTHRQRSRPAQGRKPREHVATGPCQVWSWDITYLPGPVRGLFFYLYLMIDVWSRKIMGARVHEVQSDELAAELLKEICDREHLDPNGIVLHSDSGGPMKGSTMKATMENLGVIASFSRSRVSNDNPYSEAMFRTLKYRPEYPCRAFASLAEAQAWVAAFVQWYNHEHLHSGIRFVTPADRHSGREQEVLNQRTRVYEEAHRRNPGRWSGNVRSWEPVAKVYLNPETNQEQTAEHPASA